MPDIDPNQPVPRTHRRTGPRPARDRTPTRNPLSRTRGARRPDAAREQPTGPTAAQRLAELGRSLLRPTRSQLILTLALAMVGFGLAVQIRSVRTDDAFSSMRRADLIAMLDVLDSESSRLENEVSALKGTRSQLESGVDKARVASEQARARMDTLQILAGTAPASGPGIRLTIQDPQGKLTANTLIDALQEMRDAGAEAIEFNDQIRVVGQSWVGTSDGTLVVDGKPLSRPITMDVIGDPHPLEEGARFREGSSARSNRTGSAARPPCSSWQRCGSRPCTTRRRHGSPSRRSGESGVPEAACDVVGR